MPAFGATSTESLPPIEIVQRMSRTRRRLRPRVNPADTGAHPTQEDTMDSLQATLAPPETTSAHRPLRSVAAVLAGLIATFVVTTAVDIAWHALGVFPPFSQRMSDSLFVLALAYRIPFN